MKSKMTNKNVFILGFGILTATTLSISACKVRLPKQKKKPNSGAESAPQSNQEDNNSQAALPHGVPIFASRSALPPCNTDYANSIVYVQNEKAFYSCTSEAKDWEVAQIDISIPPSQLRNDPVTRSVQDNFAAALPSLAFIESKYANTNCTRYDSGSGFVIGEGLVATNGHVVAPKTTETACGGDMKLQEIKVWFVVDGTNDTNHQSRAQDALVTRVDRSAAAGKSDIALLETVTGTRKALVLSPRDANPSGLSGDGVKAGEQVVQLGFSGATSFVHLATGRINAVAKIGNSEQSSSFLSSLVSTGVIAAGTDVYEYDLVSGAGSSGGPVLDLEGSVIAINFAGNTKDADTEFGYGIPVIKLRELTAQTRTWEAVAGP